MITQQAAARKGSQTTFGVSVAQDLLKRVDRHAEAQDSSRSRIIRRALEMYLRVSEGKADV